MKKNLFARLFSAAALMLGAGTASAASITATVLTPEAGTTYNATGLHTYETRGGNIGHLGEWGGMDGMRVTVAFSDGSTETQLWTGDGASSGHASGSGWNLEMSGNTDWTPWVFENTGNLTISSLLLEGRPGLVAFDYLSTPEYSPGSDTGWTLTGSDAILEGSDDVSVQATYRDQLQVGGVFYGDLYLTLELDFLNAGLQADQWLEFSSDTDNIKAIPEPGALALMSLGLVGLGFARRRKS